MIFPTIPGVMGAILTSVVIGGGHQRPPSWNRCHSAAAAVKLLDGNLQEPTQLLAVLGIISKDPLKWCVRAFPQRHLMKTQLFRQTLWSCWIDKLWKHSNFIAELLSSVNANILPHHDVIPVYMKSCDPTFWITYFGTDDKINGKIRLKPPKTD